MPPKQKLPAKAIADLEAWVRMGAPDPRTGAAAVRLLLDLVARRPVARTLVELPTELIVRASTAPATPWAA